ncbi:MAG: metallophosphoesterase family protein [Solirubrobacterales bacterium]
MPNSTLDLLIAVIADTHMPKGKRELPAACVEKIRAAEALIHAGDFSTVSVLSELEALCPVVLGVYGNVDEPALWQRLPETLEVEVGGRTVAVVHDSGPKQGRLRRLRSRFPAADAVVFGHSHMPLHEQEGGFQIFNPGSPTERRRAPRPSMGLLHPGPSGLRFEHHWLG